MLLKVKGLLGGRAPAPPAAPPPKTARPAQARPSAVPAGNGAPRPARPAPQSQGDGDANPDVVPMRGIGGTRPAGPARGRPPVAQTDITENIEELAKLEGYTGKVLTAEQSAIQFPKNYRQYLAALEDGTLLIAHKHLATQAVIGGRAVLDRSTFVAKHILLVEMETIRKVYDADLRRRGIGGASADTAMMQKMVIELIGGAAEQRCSDIHVEVKRFEAMIFLRSDGVMAKLRDMPAGVANDFCQAAFNMADASDASYKPYEFQGARINSLKTPLPEGVQAVRLQFNPLPDGGRYLVMRLLYAQRVEKQSDIDELGYTKPQIFKIKRMRRKPIGINIISGPTGSGKSTTLQRSLDAALREINYEKNVITVEDPPEYVIVGARQLPVSNAATEEERKEKFRAAIAASLRSDPDIVMIGEIRDMASAGLAFQAAMTGHQVWASLHANSALGILDRLRDMGVDVYRLADETLVTGLIGQRLVRVLCPKCSVSYAEGIRAGHFSRLRQRVLCEVVGEETAKENLRFASGTSCGPKCRAGYTGRTVVADVIQTDRQFMELYGANQKTQAAEYWVKELDGVTMTENALLKCLTGLVDPREVEDKVGLIDEVDPEHFRKLMAKAAVPDEEDD